MKTKLVNLFILSFLILFSTAPVFPQAPLIERYNVILTAPSDNSRGSMPLGNGDIGTNAWIDKNGDLLFYLSKTDSWDENNRLCKLGLIRVSFRPSFLKKDAPIRTILNIKRAELQAYIGRSDEQLIVKMWIDANNPAVHIEAEAKQNFEMQVTMENIRKTKRMISKTTSSDAYNNYDGKNLYDTYVFPDKFVRDLQNRVAWYHHNESSHYDITMKLQGMEGYKNRMSDPLMNRVFGGLMQGEGFRSSSGIDNILISEKVRNKHRVSILALTSYPSNPEQWKQTIEQMANELRNKNFAQMQQEHLRWWEEYWNRSWIIADGSPEAENVSRAYALQRFIHACGGRGVHPVKFNGSIFTVPDYVLSKKDKETGLQEGDPDFRRWGPGFWLQNTRLIYWSMLQSGDYDLMKPFFDFYFNILEFSKHRTQAYFNHGGAHFPESMYFWGADVNDHYGWTPFEQRTDKTGLNKYTKLEFQGGLEVSALMLHYFIHTQDRTLLREKILPFVKEVLTFYDLHYPKSSGKMMLEPAQALETWWDCTNPMPEVAGLHSVLGLLLGPLANEIDANDQSEWQRMANALPEIPTFDNKGTRQLAPASRFANKQNRELPELYAVFPYQLYGLGKNTDIQVAKNALKNRDPKSNGGWPQDEIFMAYLGEIVDLPGHLNSRALAKDESLTFPGFWGPNFDWTPDQCHSSVIQLAFQAMLMQHNNDKILLTPTWPRNWNVDFKIKAPYNTTLEGQFRNGSLVNLKVSPLERKKDVQVMPAR